MESIKAFISEDNDMYNFLERIIVILEKETKTMICSFWLEAISNRVRIFIRIFILSRHDLVFPRYFVSKSTL